VVNEKPEGTFLRMQQIRDSGSVQFKSRHRRKNGGLMDLDISIAYSSHRGGLYICFGRICTGTGSQTAGS
jgi:hypothetical protein